MGLAPQILRFSLNQQPEQYPRSGCRSINFDILSAIHSYTRNTSFVPVIILVS